MIELLVSDILPHYFSNFDEQDFIDDSSKQEWNNAKVIPSHKKGSTTDVNNYCPISLLSTFSKIVEKWMAARLTSYLELHEIIYPKQSGFRAGYSTTHSLFDITENIKNTVEAKKYGCGVFIDLKKGFWYCESWYPFAQTWTLWYTWVWITLV